MILTLEETQDLNEEVKKYDKVLVDFFAVWCHPCNMLKPELESLINENPEITIIKVDVDKHPKESIKRHIMSVPTLMLFKSGEEMLRETGFMPKDELLEFYHKVA